MSNSDTHELSYRRKGYASRLVDEARQRFADLYIRGKPLTAKHCLIVTVGAGNNGKRVFKKIGILDQMGAGSGKNKRRSATAAKTKLPVLKLEKWDKLLKRSSAGNASLAEYYFNKPGFNMDNGRPFFTSEELRHVLNEILRDAITEGVFQFATPVDIDDFGITSQPNSPQSLLGVDREIITIEYFPDGNKMAWEVTEPWYRFPFEKMKDVKSDLVMLHAAIWGIFKHNRLGT